MNTIKLNLSIVLSFSILIALSACVDELANSKTSVSEMILKSPEAADQNPNEDLDGESISSPYAVAVMQEAFTLIDEQYLPAGISEQDIQATHLYISATLNSSEEFDELYNDELIDWESKPIWNYQQQIPTAFEVDEEVENDDTEEVMDGGDVLTEQVADASISFPITIFSVTSIENESHVNSLNSTTVLEELHLPDEEFVNEWFDDEEQYQEYLDEIENVSHALVGNDNPYPEEEGLFKRKKKWYPAGCHKVDHVVLGAAFSFDDPVVRVKVKCKRGFRIRSGYTDDKGCYSLKFLRGKGDYKIIFESETVKITNGWMLARSFIGPRNRRSDWSHLFRYGNHEEFSYATLINAAYFHEIYSNTLGVTQPFRQPPNPNRINIRAVHSDGSGVWSPFGNRIKIYTRSNGNKGTYRLSDVTFHELAHQVHLVIYSGNQLPSDLLIRESWGEVVANEFLKFRFLAQDDLTNRQDELISMMDQYSPLFIDLIDIYNQQDEGTRLNDRPRDQVSRLTLTNIESALANRSSRECIRDNLKSVSVSPSLPSDAIDKLFADYDDVVYN